MTFSQIAAVAAVAGEALDAIGTSPELEGPTQVGVHSLHTEGTCITP